MTNNLRVLLARKSQQSPVGILAVLQFLPAFQKSVKLEFHDSAIGASVIASDGTELVGMGNIARFFVRSSPKESKLYPSSDASASSLIDYWVDFADVALNVSDFPKLNSALTVIDQHLKMRSFFVGYQVTVADLCMFGALRSSNIFLRIIKGKDAPMHLSRWYSFIQALPEVRRAMDIQPPALASAKSNSSVNKKDQQQGSFDIDLPGAEMGKLCTRFPPEASGYLHIGHAKAALLNQYFAQHYKGKLIVRFDDTNPSKEKLEFEEAILEDLEMLNIRGDVLTYTSDHFDKLYAFALDLIKKGKAYVDDTAQEEMRAQRMDGIASRCRDLSVEDNLKRFEDMKNSTDFGVTCCLRAKMSVDSKNKALRDPVMYRCNKLPHARTGDKWKIYPTYDFACPIVDSVEGVTHALRTNEYHDRNDQYFWFLDELNLRKPHIWDYSRVNFVYTLLSKRKLTWFVENNHVSGWDDPRFPTVRGILRRGMTVEALKKYILMQGASKNNLLLEWDKLWNLNKQVIDPVSPRYCALNSDDQCELVITDGPEAPYEQEIAKHKKNPDLGMKKTVFANSVLLEKVDAENLKVGEEVTLMDWGNVIVQKVATNGTKLSIEGKLNPGGDFKKTKKLTWLSNTPHLVPAKLMDYDYLITKKKLEEEDSFETFVNPVTEFGTAAVGDQNLKLVKKGDIIQLERKGYYICDAAYDAATKSPVKLILIPDGKTASIALKAQPAK